jgi:hypothetical protein
LENRLSFKRFVKTGPGLNRLLLGTSFIVITSLALDVSAQSMIVESLTGALTQNEINAFRTYAQQKIALPSNGIGNVWVFGAPGKAIEACGLMYEASKDTAILDRMIYLCDAALSQRNDLASAANGGQLTTWSGAIEPIWPVSAGPPATGDVEQGQVLSHMAFCAKLILETPSIWDARVAIGDPKGYGATYKARAIKYVDEADYVLDKWILARFIKASESNHYYFPDSPNTYKPLDPAPWNQAWMVTNSLVRLGLCHLMLQDDPARVAKYDAIARPNIAWFFANLTANKSASNSACWKWAYAYPSGTEDANHFAYDAEGLWIAYKSGRFGVTFSDLVPFANTYFDIILATVTNGIFAGRVDGTTGTGNAGGDDYVRDEYIYLTEFRPEKFATVGTIEISTGHIAASPPITGRLLWAKNFRSSFAIAASSDTNGVIIPLGSVNVTSGATQSFLISPDAKYQVDSLIVDNVNQGALSSYTFTNVKAAHTIRAKFKVQPTATGLVPQRTSGAPVIRLVRERGQTRLVVTGPASVQSTADLFALSGKLMRPAATMTYSDLPTGIYIAKIAAGNVATYVQLIAGR